MPVSHVWTLWDQGETMNIEVIIFKTTAQHSSELKWILEVQCQALEGKFGLKLHFKALCNKNKCVIVSFLAPRNERYLVKSVTLNSLSTMKVALADCWSKLWLFFRGRDVICKKTSHYQRNSLPRLWRTILMTNMWQLCKKWGRQWQYNSNNSLSHETPYLYCMLNLVTGEEACD